MLAWWELFKGSAEGAAGLVHLGERDGRNTVLRTDSGGADWDKRQEASRRQAGQHQLLLCPPASASDTPIPSMLFPWSTRNRMVLSTPPGSPSLATDCLLFCPNDTRVGRMNGKEHSLIQEPRWPTPILPLSLAL